MTEHNKPQPSFFGRVFRFLGRSIDFLRTLLGRILFLVVVGVVIFLIFGGPEPLQVPDDGLVVLAPRGAIVEQSAALDPVSMLLGSGGVASTSLRDILETLDQAAEDDRIKGVLLDLAEMGAVSAANLESIGMALDNYKASGKELIAYADAYSQPQYLLASYANSVYLHPMGQLMLPGYGGSQLFFADLLDKLGVNVHVFRVGTHKAAVEPYLLNGMSEESRSNNQQLADELWLRYVNQVAVNRELSDAAVRRYTNDYAGQLLEVGGDTARLALESGLVDELLSRPQLHDRLLALTGATEDLPFIDFKQYLALNTRPHLPAQNQIGVIVAQGTIDMGEQPRGTIGAETLIQLIRDARQDDSIKAVVLRLDSPGGSALASELIREELERLQAAGKPLVVSMAGVAASGGYWISANADEIWASPVTITGSIGIFGMVPTFEGTLAKAGVHADGIGTTPLTRADMFSGMTEPMMTVFQANVEDGYRRFLNLVAQGREMSVEQVDAVGQGQVWSGSRALEYGLVDNLGDLPDAVAAAARLANVSDYELRYIEKALTPAEQFLQQLANNIGVDTLASANAAIAQHVTGAQSASNAPVLVNAFGAWQQLFGDVSAMARFNDPLNLYSLCELCELLH